MMPNTHGVGSYLYQCRCLETGENSWNIPLSLRQGDYCDNLLPCSTVWLVDGLGACCEFFDALKNVFACMYYLQFDPDLTQMQVQS